VPKPRIHGKSDYYNVYKHQEFSQKELMDMVRLGCLKHDCNGTMNLAGIAQNGALFYWCPYCERLFIVPDSGVKNKTEYQMRAWQTPTILK